MQVLFIIGRILLGGYFVYSGYNHLANLAAMTGYASMKKVPAAKTMVIVSGILLVLGGLAVIFNRYAILGMCVLVLVLLPITFMMHRFWKEGDGNARMMERVQFFKNMGLIGALILLVSIG